MLEYLLDNYYMPLYFIALVLCIIKYQLYYDTVLRYFPILLTYTFMTEVLGLIVRDVDDIQLVYRQEYYNYNTIIFNIYDIIFFLYFFYVYYQLSNNRLTKNLIKYGGATFLLTCIVNLFIQDFFTEPQNFAIIIGSIILVYAASIYLYKLIITKHRLPLYRNLLFWLSAGILFFYICYPITMYILSFNYDFFTIHNLSKHHYISIGIFYACIITGLIFMKRLRIANEVIK
ncbi:hypothetical protein SAMN04488007_1622 [Maribacter aquivivus]|uniref:Uncharacterized protein n=1 Tax=Maribacter aquivivus TaxID=228958 RepID=A0A1M6MK68_9FLAO|nr:hypothetical protein SAMN04488007_1622 [Maribacter aquivivus]